MSSNTTSNSSDLTPYLLHIIASLFVVRIPVKTQLNARDIFLGQTGHGVRVGRAANDKTVVAARSRFANENMTQLAKRRVNMTGVLSPI